MDYDRFLQAQMNEEKKDGTRSIFMERALFSDITDNFVIPCEPAPYDEVTIGFRTARNNVDRVFLVHKNQKYLMQLDGSKGEFDYYSITVQLENEILAYHFEIHAGEIRCLYDTRGVVQSIEDHYLFRIFPGFHTPDWAKGAVMYQIFVDRFYNGDQKNDVLTDEYRYIGRNTVQAEWDTYPEDADIHRFYGGDLQGIIDKLDYLEGLGIDVIYLNPIFVSPSSHKYDIQDYDYVDPHLGCIVFDEGELLPPGQTENRFASRYINRVTDKRNLEASNELLAKLISQVHERGMKLILDGVFNHCGSFHKWMDRERIYENAEGYAKGAFVEKKSPYSNFFKFYEKDQWPYNTTYDGWWGHDTLPKLNYEGSRELYEYILEIGRKWVSAPYNADGWRLDVAADLGMSPEMNHQFWKDFRSAVKSANPEAIIIAEHYGNPAPWLNGREWDTVMNYDAFMEPVSWFLTGMEKHSDDFRGDLLGNADSLWGAMHYHCTDMPMPALQTAMNELSNHDHSRFLTRTNQKIGRMNQYGSEAANEGVRKEIFRAAVVIQMTWPGAPTVYYGDEAGVCGFTDPDNRRTYPWGHEDQEMIAFHRAMIQIHKENPEILTGSFQDFAREPNLVAYTRFNRENQCFIIVNRGEMEIYREFELSGTSVPGDAVLKQLILTDAKGYTQEEKYYPIQDGKLKITLPAVSAIVLKYKWERKKIFPSFR